MQTETVKNWALEEMASADIGDARLNKRLGHLLEILGANPHKTIPAACNGWSETLAAYRFFNNPQVTPENILSPHKEMTVKRIQQEAVVLIVQDTTEIDYSHRDTVAGMGYLSFESQQGFYLHPSIALTPERVCLGVVDGHMWVREQLGRRFKHQSKPIEEKESYRWLQGYQVANEIALQCPDTLIVNVADREGDIYELLMQSPEKHKAHWLVRATQNRRLVKDTKGKDALVDKLWEKANQAPKVGNIEFYVPATPERTARKVKQTVRSRRVCLKPPKRTGCKLLPVEVNVVLCSETKPPKGEKALQWLLLTSVEMKTAERALEVVQWYLCRWQIEVFFKILKSGCEIEELQFESFTRTANCLALYLIVAWRILYVTMLGRHCPELRSDDIFDEREWKSVYAMTQRKKPPPKAPGLNEMIKMIASLGGHLGRKHDGAPGPHVMWIGMQRMHDFALAWEVFSGLKQ
jgi:hypothetical protein